MITLSEKQTTELKGQDLLTLANLSADTIQTLLEKAVEIKKAKQAGESFHPLQGKTLGMIFEKPSTRTRVSFEAGMYQLGGQALYLNSQDLQIGRGETIADTAQVLSEYLDAIMIRTFSHSIVEELAQYASIPVINGLTDLFHPCQALADLLTIYEHKGTFKGKKLVYVGDGNNVAHSLMIASAKMGMDFAIACPIGYEPNKEVVKLTEQIAAKSGSSITVTNDPIMAVSGADFVYTDVWTSMGQEKENAKRLADFSGYQVNEELVAHANKDYLFMHCLPAHRGEEVSAGVMDGKNSVVFQQAGNRLHAQKALLTMILG